MSSVLFSRSVFHFSFAVFSKEGENGNASTVFGDVHTAADEISTGWKVSGTGHFVHVEPFKAIFVWPWNNNAPTIQKQSTNGNRAIWLVYRTDTNACGFWLVKRTFWWKNLMPEELSRNQPILRFDVMLQRDGPIGQCLLHLGFSLAGKRRSHVLIFLSVGW